LTPAEQQVWREGIYEQIREVMPLQGGLTIERICPHFCFGAVPIGTYRLSLLIRSPTVLLKLVASLRRFFFLKAELLVELFVRLTVDLEIRVDEVI